jgi:hypothetical protein
MKIWNIAARMKRRSGTERFREARDKGCSYLLGMCRTDGGFGKTELGIADYHKALAAFVVCGHNYTANRLCDWIRRCGMTPEGDFGPRPEGFEDFRYTYPNSWVIIGAHRLGSVDISMRGMDFLMGFRDSESGGFYSSSTKRDADTEQDIIYVSFCGLAAIYTGRIEAAVAAGVWMRTVMEAQPDFPKKIYTVYTRSRGLHIAPDTERRYVVSSDALNYQFFFQPGAASAFLATLYLATDNKMWLELSREYLRFAEGASDYLFRLLAAGKVGWAASLLSTITGERKYREMAIRIGDNLIAAQSSQGCWNLPGTQIPDNSITAEMVTWLDAIHQAAGHE